MRKLSDNIYKNIERERQNFACVGISFMDEVLPKEEGRKLDWLGIPKDCSLRTKMMVVAVWLGSTKGRSFEEIKEILES